MSQKEFDEITEKRIEGLEAEVKALREALERICGLDYWVGDNLAIAKDIAREALHPSPKTQDNGGEG